MARGRTRDAAAHRNILEATFELLGERGAGQVRIDDIAALAGVGKQTIYRWWPSKHAVVIDALLQHSTGDTPFPDTRDARQDLRQHMLAVVRVFTSSTGALLREILAESYGNPEIARGFVDRFWQPRRELSTAFLRRAMERGEVRSDVDVESALDAVYSPLWCRLLIGHQPLGDEFVDQVLDVVWPGLAAPVARTSTPTSPGPTASTSTQGSGGRRRRAAPLERRTGADAPSAAPGCDW